MQRFFVSPEVFDRQPIVLTGDQAHQIRRVLRMRLGDSAIVLDGRGRACESRLIAVGEDEVKLQVLQRVPAGIEPHIHITLFQAVLKGERFGWALQKGTEIGVSAFVPLICERNVVDDLAAVDGKRGRWERIIQEAAEQSGRALLPQLGSAQLFAHAVQPAVGDPNPASPAPIRLIPWESERGVSLRRALASRNLAAGPRIQLFVGPEGGFTDAEIGLAGRYGVQSVSLGPRILRAETAGIVASALILYEVGDMEAF